jgi:hypothetical protein
MRGLPPGLGKSPIVMEMRLTMLSLHIEEYDRDRD